mmetsp:Transcript_96353/g.272505  ORF Transcript_96353/g.272505 Transcript_96353/m.272505 type:complete len:339 (-) Transcript_96353:118-1134(-)
MPRSSPTQIDHKRARYWYLFAPRIELCRHETLDARLFYSVVPTQYFQIIWRPAKRNSNPRLWVLPLEVGILDFVTNRCELPRLLFFNPEVPNLIAHARENGIPIEPLEPRRELRKMLLLVEDFGPTEDARQHELHEDASGVPRHVRMSHLVASHKRVSNCGLKPCQLLPDFSELRGACRPIHGTLLGREGRGVRREVHSSLRVREVRLRAVRGGDVQIVATAQKVDEGFVRGAVRQHGGPFVAIGVLQIRHDDACFEDRGPVLRDEARHLFQRVDPPEFLRLQIRVCNHPRVDFLLQALQAQPEADPRRVVRMSHVEKRWLCRRRAREAANPRRAGQA